MIKNTFMFFVLVSTLLVGKNITFQNAPRNPIHKLPNRQNQIASFNSILKDAMDSVVNISTSTINYRGNINRRFFEEFFGTRIPPKKSNNSLGSGVIVSKDGYIVTNNHVIEGADEIRVTLSHGDKEYIAKLIGRDKGSDLAVIKIEANNLKPIVFSNSDDMRVGDIVFAIGNPFGIGETVTQGIISALNKYDIGINQYENFIQTDASINPGNSGGALIDSRGALIGINSAIISPSGGNNGVGFSIPVNIVKNVITKLILNGKVDRGFMGVSISKLDKDLKRLYHHKKGAVIVDVQPNSPAQRAGIQRGDLIYNINGKKIKNPHELQQVVTSYSPNDTITIYLEREGTDIKKYLRLSNLQGDLISLGDIDKSFEGLYITNLNQVNRSQFQIPPNITGAIIQKVDINSQTYNNGFREGDIIIQIENRKIRNTKDVIDALRLYKHRTKRIYINRGGMILLIVK